MYIDFDRLVFKFCLLVAVVKGYAVFALGTAVDHQAPPCKARVFSMIQSIRMLEPQAQIWVLSASRGNVPQTCETVTSRSLSLPRAKLMYRVCMYNKLLGMP